MRLRAVALLTLCLLTACGSHSSNPWDSYSYTDNDANYTLPPSYSCADDAPNCN